VPQTRHPLSSTLPIQTMPIPPFPRRRKGFRRRQDGLATKLLSFASLLLILPTASALHHMKRFPTAWIEPRANTVPLVVSNQCKETIYAGVATQAGTSPGTNGFRLGAGETRNMTVGHNWQGRVWPRTNCSFNAAGTGPSNTGGNNGGGAACSTGDCFGVVECQVAVSQARHAVAHAARNLTTIRARLQQLWPSSLSQHPAAKRSTTSHSSTATTSRSASCPCTPNLETSRSLISRRTSQTPSVSAPPRCWQPRATHQMQI